MLINVYGYVQTLIILRIDLKCLDWAVLELGWVSF